MYIYRYYAQSRVSSRIQSAARSSFRVAKKTSWGQSCVVFTSKRVVGCTLLRSWHRRGKCLGETIVRPCSSNIQPWKALPQKERGCCLLGSEAHHKIGELASLRLCKKRKKNNCHLCTPPSYKAGHKLVMMVMMHTRTLHQTAHDSSFRLHASFWHYTWLSESALTIALQEEDYKRIKTSCHLFLSTLCSLECILKQNKVVCANVSTHAKKHMLALGDHKVKTSSQSSSPATGI